jgi:hypothetical protein
MRVLWSHETAARSLGDWERATLQGAGHIEAQKKACKEAITCAKSNQTAIMALIFSTRTNFLCRDGKTLWYKIVTKQTKQDTWTDLHSLEHVCQHCKTMATLLDCKMLFLMTVFENSSAEDMKFYITWLKTHQGWGLLILAASGGAEQLHCMSLEFVLLLGCHWGDKEGCLNLQWICCISCPRCGSTSSTLNISHLPMWSVSKMHWSKLKLHFQ